MAVSLRVLPNSPSIPPSAFTSSSLRRRSIKKFSCCCTAAGASSGPEGSDSRLYIPDGYSTSQRAAPKLIGSIYEEQKHKLPKKQPRSTRSMRILRISMPLVPKVVEMILAKLMSLDWADPKAPIYVLINSTGTTREDGEVVARETQGFAVYDALMTMRCQITTIAVGFAYGHAALLLAAGTKGRRFMYPDAQIGILHPQVAPSGLIPADSVQTRVNEAVYHKDEYLNLMSKHTDMSVEFVTNAIRKPLYLDPVQAVEYGVVDRVLWRGNVTKMKSMIPPEEWEDHLSTKDFPRDLLYKHSFLISQFPSSSSSSSSVEQPSPPLRNYLPTMLSHAHTRNSEQLVMGVQRIEKVDLWKTKARILQLRLRDRFRVAVDRHLNRRPEVFAEGYFSGTVTRLLSRFRDFRRESLASPSAFYRKRVSKELNAEEESMILRMVQAVAVPLLGNMCYVFMNGLNSVQVHGLEKLHKALLERPKGTPLVTVSNHVASVDDPFVIASLLPPSVILDAQNLRWTLCASDRCFKNSVTSAFFKSVKVLPLTRGHGVYQKGMDKAIAKLNTGGWVHIFPEGSRSRDGGKTMGSIKRGVGRLVLDADTLPIVVPFVHTGMQEIMPIGSSLPKIGKTVTVLVGDPIYLDDLANAELERDDLPRGKLYDAVASRIGERLQKMKATVEQLALHPSSPELLQQEVDWARMESAKDHEFGKLTLSSTAAQESRYESSSLVGRVSSRMAAYWDSTELAGFAARGLFSSFEPKVVDSPSVEGPSPLRAWRQYLEDNLQQQMITC
ncbi:ATP-dependent Clp protease proteolytic subunit-related protein 3, chloroplastic [Linum grandiflorum]